jgi:hypothetical protein
MYVPWVKLRPFWLRFTQGTYMFQSCAQHSEDMTEIRTRISER